MIATLLPLLAPLALLAPLDVGSSSPDFGSIVQELANEFSSAATQLLQVIDGTVIDVTRVAYITVLILGIFLYFTRIQKRLGRDLITGGIVLAVLSEFVFPVIVRA